MSKTKKKEKRSFIQIIKWFIGVSVILFGGLILSAMFFEEEIGELAIRAVKDQMNTEVEVGDASLSFINSFPSASVQLHQVLILDSKKDTVLFLEDFSLQCSIWGVINGDYNFKGLYAGYGLLKIHVDQRGKNNLEGLWKTNEEPTDFRMSISNAQVEQLDIQYQNLQTNQFFNGQLKSGLITGDFIIDNARNMNLHTIRCDVDMVSNQLVANGIRFLEEQPIDVQGEITVDNAKSVFSFDQLSVWVNNDEFMIDGSITGTEKGSRYAIQSKSESARLSTLLECIPLPSRTLVNGLESYADISFSASVMGDYTASQLPEVRVQCQFNGGRITHPLLAGSLRDVSFQIQYSNGNGMDRSTQVVEINAFRSRLNGEWITMDFDMTGTNNPYINLSIDGIFSMSSMYPLFGEGVTDGFGSLAIDSLSLSGYLRDMMSKEKVYKVKQSGTVYPDQIGLELNGLALSIDSGRVDIDNNNVKIQRLNLSSRNTKLRASGELNNLLPVLFSDQTTITQSTLNFDMEVHIDQMDVDEVWRLGGGNASEWSDESDKDSIIQASHIKREQFTKRLNGQIALFGTDIMHPHFSSDQINGKLQFKDGVVQIQHCIAKAYGGSFEINSKIHVTQTPYGVIFLDVSQIDVNTMFEQTNSFGQQVLTHKHLKGRLDALMKMDIFFDSSGQFDQQRFMMLADVRIQDGELNDFEMLESFAKYIKMKDLQRIKFTELNNQFKIENRELIVPAMFIQSNASNLLVGGTYSFDHEVDFKIKINAGQLFFNNFKKYNPQREPLKARKKGLFNVYAQIYGNMMGEIEYRLGPKYAKRSLENELSQRLPQISNVLKKEFSPYQKNGKEVPVRILTQPEDWEDAMLEDMEELEYIQW